MEIDTKRDCIFWVDGEIKIVKPINSNYNRVYTEDLPDNYLGKFCVDCFWNSTISNTKVDRYGIYFISANKNIEWEHKPKEFFPKEFLAALLLLGVN